MSETDTPIRLFDTRDDKPKLAWLRYVSIAAAIIVALLSLQAKANAVWINLIMAFYYLAMMGLLFYSFIEQMRYNPYSYNTIFYFGFALFAGFLLFSQLFVMRSYYQDVEAFNEFMAFQMMRTAAMNFIVYTSPFLFLFSIGLSVSNISLIRHEGKSFVNLLGIVLSFLIVFGALFLYLGNYYVSGSRTQVMIHDLIFHLLACLYLYFECMLIGTVAAGIIVTWHQPEYNRDYMIILGCGMFRDGTPTPLLRDRIERALVFYREQLKATGKKLTFITSGGKGENEPVSESRCMANYLIEKGIPEEQILLEEKSTSTYENMLYSKELIKEDPKDVKISFSTSNFHVFRSGLFARRVKMRATGIGAKTRWYFWPNAAVREFAGLLSRHKGKQALILFSMLLVSVLLTLLEYR